jgi:hypothetical protein
MQIAAKPSFRLNRSVSLRRLRASRLTAAMSEIERLWALARYASERDRLPIAITEPTALTVRGQGMYSTTQGEALFLKPARNAHRALGVVPGNSRRASRLRGLARFILPGLIIDVSFAGTDRSLSVGLTSADYVHFAEIGALLYAALALAVLARRVWRL